MDIQKLNQGLSRVVSVKSCPKRRRPYLSRRTTGRVFRIGVLHAKELTEEALRRNRRGFINAQVTTVAHAPSLYHWLFHRCGIPFAETQALVQSGRLRVNGAAVERLEDLESQLEWDVVKKLDIQVASNLPALRQDASSGSEEGSTRWVPALQRALHRSYHFMYIHPGISMSSEEANPKSFVHRLAPHLGGSSDALGLNILRPIGFMDGMRGLAIATNDVAMVRYWNNEFMGNSGVFDVRFHRGIPHHEVQRLGRLVENILHDGIGSQLSSTNLSIPCSCSVQGVPPATRDSVLRLYPRRELHDERLLVRSPILPYRAAKQMQKAGGLVALTRSGPFVLPPNLAAEPSGSRSLTPAELALLFTFERRLKTNRLVLSLSEFGRDKEAD